jgi:hypothetical protein
LSAVLELALSGTAPSAILSAILFADFQESISWLPFLLT